MKKRIIIITGLLALAFMATGFACADPSIPATPEAQGITTTTSAQVSGWFDEEQDMSWQISTSPLGSSLTYPNPSIPVGPYVIYVPGNIVLEELFGDINTTRGGVLYSSVYSESTTATNGDVEYSRQFSADTGNQLAGGSNIEAERLIAFSTDTSGRLVSSEYIMVDGVGQFSLTDNVLLCPFASDASEFVPQFCNMAEMGSDLDISTGSVSTTAGDRFISATGDYPVTVDYGIRLTGIDDEPADGSVSAFMNALDMEGEITTLARVPFENPDDGTFYLLQTGLASELRFDELSSVHGQIAVFDKVMHYESGMRR
jgi:hypothetical protein